MDTYESTLTEADRIKRRLDANAVVSRPFPFKPEQYQYPQPALNVGNQLYMTSNMEYGRLKPTEYEIQTRWHPNNNTFTSSQVGGPFENNSLKTAVTRSKVNDYFDGFD